MEKNAIQKISVLIPDGECDFCKSVINGLVQSPGVKIYVMSSVKRNLVKYSRYVFKYTYYERTDNQLVWIGNINTEVEKYDIDLILPLWDANIKVLLEHRDTLPFKHKLALLPSLNDFNTARNKGLLSVHLAANGIPGPKSIPLESISELDKVDSLSFPMLIKPVQDFYGGGRIRLLNSKKDIEHFFIDKKIDYVNIAQEYLEGYDYGCNVLCKNGTILAFTIQKGDVADEKKFAPSIKWEFVYESELYAIIEKLMKSLNWSGVANVDLLYDKNRKQFNVLEINTRFWGSLEGSIIAGVNFPYLYCLASLGRDFNKPRYDFIKYSSIVGLRKMLKRNKKLLFNPAFILKNTPIKFALRDPLPLLYKLLFSKD